MYISRRMFVAGLLASTSAVVGCGGDDTRGGGTPPPPSSGPTPPPVITEAAQVITLPPPQFAKDQYYRWLQSPPIRVFSDGSNWFDVSTTPATLIEAWWAPARCTFHADWENNRFYWNGKIRSSSDLKNTNGDFVLDETLGVTDSMTVNFEYRYDFSQPVSGTLLSWWSADSRQRGEIVAYDIDENRKLWRIYSAKDGGGADFLAPNLQSKFDEGGSFDGRGRQRAALRVSNGQPLYSRNGPGDLQIKPFGDGKGISLNMPTKFAFGSRAWDEGDPLKNGEFFFATIWPEALEDDHLFDVNAPVHVPRFHLLGDSFLNLYKLHDAFRLRLEEYRDQYYAISQDGVGGTSERQQAERFANGFAKWHDSILILENGGRDYSSDPGTVEGRNAYFDAALQSILATLSHDRWVVTEAAPNTVLGTEARTEWNQTEAHIRSRAADHWLETLAPTQALSNGSAEDEDFVKRLGLHPLSLRVSEEDFHPNSNGTRARGAIIADAVVARGYLEPRSGA